MFKNRIIKSKFLINQVRNASKLVHSEYGPACEVISQVDYETPVRQSSGNPENVLVEMKLSTINPADLNMIQVMMQY